MIEPRTIARPRQPVAWVALALVGATAGCVDGKREPPPTVVVSTGGMSGDGGVVSLEPVSLRNLTVKLVSKYKCDPNEAGTMIDCAQYQFTFALRNNTSTPGGRLEQVEFELGGETFRSDLIRCSDVPWTMEPFSTTSVIDLMMTYNFMAMPPGANLAYPCGAMTTGKAIVGPVPEAQYEGAVTVRVTGLLSDATPWLGEATVALIDASR
jgi:hypothetical protein